MPSMSATIEERTMDRLISALSRMKRNGGVVGNLGGLFLQSGEALCGDDHKTDLMALRYLKSSRDALRVILQVANDEIHILQEKCLLETLHRGIQSLPDDILMKVFEFGYETFDNRFWDHTFPVAVSHVNSRFRSTALSTPRIWTNLSNRIPSAQLETFICRSKGAELSIFLDLCEPWEYKPCDTETFFEITKTHSDRWSSFTYQCHALDDTVADEVLQLGYTHPALSQCRHLTLPRLRSLSCRKYDFEKAFDIMPNPEAILATWTLPELVHFNGLNALIEGSSIGKNVRSCDLRFDGDSSWDFRKLLRELESWSHLEALSFYVSDLKRAPRVCQSSLPNVTSFSIEVGKSVDVGFIAKFFSLVKMPVISSMAITFRDERGSDVKQMINTICTTANRYSTLEKFGLDSSGVQGASYDTLQTVASNLPFLQEVSFRGTHIYGYQRYDCPSWRKFTVEGAILRDWDDIEIFIGRMETSSHWDSFELQIADCSGLCGVIPEARRRLGEKLQYAGRIS